MGFGAKIRAAREAKGMCMRDLAEKVGVTAATVCRWENETKTPRLENLFRLSATLDVPVSDFLKEGDSTPESIVPE